MRAVGFHVFDCLPFHGYETLIAKTAYSKIDTSLENVLCG